MSIQLREIKLILSIAMPLMAAFLAQKGMQLIDTIMMGWIGPEALAAGVLGTGIFITNVVFCLGVLSAAGIQIARALGANEHDHIRESLLHGIYLVCMLSVPCMFILWFSPYLLHYLGNEPNVLEKTIELLHGLMWGFPGFLLFFVFREFFAAFSLTRIVMLIVLCILPLTYIGNYIFIYGKFGLPPMGVVGIGYAGAIIMWLMFFSMYGFSKLIKKLNQHLFSIHDLTFDYRIILSMLKVGLPSGILFVLDSGMFTTATFLMAHFGVDALAAHSIAMQCASFVYAVPFGLSMTIALQVGHAAGAKDLVRAKRIGYTGLFIGLFLSFIIGLLFILVPQLFIRLFLDGQPVDTKIIEYAVAFLFVAALFQCFDVLQAIMNGALRGFKDTFIPMLLCISCFWILGIGSSYYLGFYTPLGAMGIWYGLTIGLFSASVVLLIRFIRKPI